MMHTDFAGMRIESRQAWWFGPYIWLLATLCVLMGTRPDPDKVRRVMLRALRMYLRRADGSRTRIV